MQRRYLRSAVDAGILIVLVLAGWFAWNLQSRSESVPVIIYLVDTLRADRMGIYGYGPDTSPHIDALAAESVVFDQAYAPSPWTLPSVASLITSTYPCEHGLLTERYRLNSSQSTLAQMLTKAGYFTAGRYSNVLVGPNSGLDRGYAVFESRKGEKQHAMTGHLERMLQGIGDNPFLLYLHTVEPHDPYLVPARRVPRFGHVTDQSRQSYREAAMRFRNLTTEAWSADKPNGSIDNAESLAEIMRTLNSLRESIQVLYDAAIFDADTNLGDVISTFRKLGVWDKAIFIFVSDHGEEFGEHGGWFHEQSMYEELTRVPLIIRFPHGEYGGQHIKTPVSLLDIVPTILEYLDHTELCAGCRGINLLPLLNVGKLPNVAESRVTGLRMNRRQFYMPWKIDRGDDNVVIRQSHWKGIWNAELKHLELYNLLNDPHEKLDVGGEHPVVVETLASHAETWLQSCLASQQTPEKLETVDRETEEQLRALGYLN